MEEEKVEKAQDHRAINFCIFATVEYCTSCKNSKKKFLAKINH